MKEFTRAASSEFEVKSVGYVLNQFGKRCIARSYWVTDAYKSPVVYKMKSDSCQCPVNIFVAIVSRYHTQTTIFYVRITFKRVFIFNDSMV